MNIKAEEGDSDDSILKKPVEWTKTSNGSCCNEDSDSDGDSDDELVYASTGFPPPPPGKRLAPVGQEVDAEEVRDGKEAPQVSCDMTGFDSDGKAIQKVSLRPFPGKLFRFAKLRPINF